MVQLANNAYRDLISDIADMEPVSGWLRAADLPPLESDAVLLVLAERQKDVADELVIDARLIARLYASAEPTADAAIAAHMRSALELACRETIWLDVSDKCDSNSEARQERANEAYYGGSGPLTAREQLARDFGVSRLLK